jgi:hypothetical protein
LITLAHTITNANNVPMLVMCPTTEIGANAENRLTNTMNSRFDRHGVRNFGWMDAKMPGSRPSRDIE